MESMACILKRHKLSHLTEVFQREKITPDIVKWHKMNTNGQKMTWLLLLKAFVANLPKQEEDFLFLASFPCERVADMRCFCHQS